MSESTLRIADPLAPVRYLDVVLIVLAAPIVILLGGPVLGYAAGAGIWLVQRVLEAWLDAAARRADTRRALALKFMSMIGRTWLVVMAILVVGLTAEREDGFAAAVLCLAAYTVHLATALMLRPMERNPQPLMSSGKKIALIVVSIYVGLIVLTIALYGWSRLDNEEFKPQNEFKLETWVDLGILEHQQGGALPVHRHRR